MATGKHEDIARTEWAAFIRGALAKDKRSLDTYVLENHIHTQSEGSMIKKEIS
jgi:hypothetical protein